ncbi:uncharacterized protein LOC121367130, partial [Gigantopelta aegis]|uniref:uncharacterized protein LOC121367130 n=1 Tax=Gigantopelta aegis TaxID=1735272 RepID=UPI001B88CEEB
IVDVPMVLVVTWLAVLGNVMEITNVTDFTETVETDVWMACDPGLYGADCSFICTRRHCLNKAASCDNMTGSCGGECEESWRGEDCTGCDGKYGRDCSYSCSDRKCRNPPVACHHVTGSCNGPCVAGWQGIACNVSETESTVSGTFFWYVRRHRATSGSTTKENTSPTNQDDEHYDIVGGQTGRERNTARVDVSYEGGYENSPRSRGTDDIPQRPLGDNERGNVNAGQDIQLNEYEHLDPSQSPQNVYDKITGN